MELAGQGAAKYLNKHHPAASVLIYCGPGNNGGDGYVIARWLQLWGHDVSIIPVSSPQTKDALCNDRLCTAIRLELSSNKQTDIVIDAILGTGQNRPLSGPYEQAVQQINRFRERGSIIYALDIPTGIDPKEGHPIGTNWVDVDGCFSFGKGKYALYRNADMGTIIDIDIGFDLLSNPPSSDTFILEQKDILDWMPKESPSHAKWNRGHVAIIARGGAAVLSAHAAFIMGAGLVSIICPQEDWNTLKGLRPEVMHATSLDKRRHDAVVLGPGITKLDDFCEIWAHFPKPMVVDAGGLTLLAKHRPQPSSYARLLTPHSAEAARLLEATRDEIEMHPFWAVQELQKFGCSILKGPYTKIGSNPMWIAPKGSIRLATAGSGDILSGMIAGLLSKGVSVQKSAAISCFFHATAGTHLLPTGSSTDLLQILRSVISPLIS
jgi:NAD(P)H-hydrate epimerase